MVDVSYDKAATGGGFYTSLVARRVGTSDYRVKVRVMPDRHPAVSRPHRERDRDGPGVGRRARDVRTGQRRFASVCRPIGTGTTTLRAKAWYTSSTEPAAWMLTATDATASLQNPGAVGIYTYVSGSATNAPVKTFLDNLWVGAL